jgi:hypothetical protein
MQFRSEQGSAAIMSKPASPPDRRIVADPELVVDLGAQLI